MVKKAAICILMVMAVVGSLTLAPAWAEVKEGAQLGNLQFPKLLEPNDAKYLGLSGTGPFTLSQVGAPYVVLEAFATSCPHCFHQAPIMNNVYNMVSQDAKLKDKVRFIAVAGGDNDTATTMWRKQLKIPFPVLADADLSLTKKLDIPGTPTTIVLDKSGKAVFVEIGAFESADEFMKHLKSKIK